MAIALTYPYQVVRARIQVWTPFLHPCSNGSLTFPFISERCYTTYISRYTNLHKNDIPARRIPRILQGSRHKRSADSSRNVYNAVVLRTAGLGLPIHRGQARGPAESVFRDGNYGRGRDRRRGDCEIIEGCLAYRYNAGHSVTLITTLAIRLHNLRGNHNPAKISSNFCSVSAAISTPYKNFCKSLSRR